MTASPAAGPRLEVPSCNLCGHDGREVLWTGQDWRFEVDAVPYPVVRCTRCNLGYLCPRPVQEDIGRYYPPTYYARRGEDDAGARMIIQARYLDGLPSGARVLDVGAARGDFVRHLRAAGWDALGLEPYPAAAPHPDAPIATSWTDDRLASETFDAVTAWSVFEHLHDPMTVFHECARVLRSGGRLVIHVPNLRSIFSRWSFQEDLPRHLYFFSERTLDAFAAASGLNAPEVVHDNRIMDGSGTGFLRIRLFQRFGGGTQEFFRWRRLPGRTARRRARPLLWAAGLPLAALEHLAVNERVRAGLRMNGYVVATFTKP